MSENPVSFHSPLSYPPVQALTPNGYYAREMLDNIGGSNSEMSAVSLYFYNNLMTSEFQSIAQIFHGIMIVEMHHLQLFGQIAMRLGENPRLWTQKNRQKYYWTPQHNKYSTNLKEILTIAAEREMNAIEKYKYQARRIDDMNIIVFLERIIVDEELHVEIFKDMLAEYC